MRAAVFRAPRTITIEDAAEPDCGPSDIVVRVGAAGVCGTDLHSYEHGAFVRPGQIMGHEFAGTVTRVGAATDDLAEGDRVAVVPLASCDRCARCLAGSPHLCERGVSASIGYGLPGSFAEYVRVPQALLGRNVFQLPETMSMAEGALVEPLSVALHAAKSLVTGPGDVAVVIGLGGVGQGVVQSLKALGAAHVVGVDVSSLRLETARAGGADTLVNAGQENVVAVVRALTGKGFGGGARADIVVECSGAPAMAALSTRLIRRGGRLRLAAMYGGTVPLDANEIVQKEIQVSGSFAYQREFTESIELIRSGRVAANQLVTHTFALEQITEAFEMQLLKDQSVKVLIAGDVSNP